MTDSEKPEGDLTYADGVYTDDKGELTAEMEVLQKGGGDRDSDELVAMARGTATDE